MSARNYWARRRAVLSLPVRNLQGQLWLVRGCDKMLLVVVSFKCHALIIWPQRVWNTGTSGCQPCLSYTYTNSSGSSRTRATL
jgi:hypothetical protein